VFKLSKAIVGKSEDMATEGSIKSNDRVVVTSILSSFYVLVSGIISH